MVMSDGFAWNGQTYDSLSKVAFAITGTKWNGPRFFGLRDRKTGQPPRRGHEASFDQTAPLRDLHTSNNRSSGSAVAPGLKGLNAFEG